MVLPHVKSAKDLQTTSESILDGSLLQARTKWKKAEPYLREAYRLRDQLQKIANIHKVSSVLSINTLATAVGFSDKAQGHLSKDQLGKAVSSVLDEIAKTHGKDFREVLLFRFLLTSGDSLGGEMRNVTGALGQLLFVKAVIKSLNIRGMVHHLTQRKEKIVEITWKGRVLLFDRKPKLIGNNIDVILLKSSHAEQAGKELIENRESYLACGELKGGIDPAGADEHWKTAVGALGRIRVPFKKAVPKLFFAGAAIEEAMSKEIFKMLASNKLDYTANLTKGHQLRNLANWLTSL